jgi:predicted nucleotidyltransferase component of viral defense system
MEFHELRDFVLVGGTALSLLYGHRKSIDLDLFSSSGFESDELLEQIKEAFSDQFFIEDKPKRFGLFCTIRNVKVDLVRYPHLPIRNNYNIDGIRFASTEDIIAMKVQAVLGRARKKDFWDIATLLEHYSVEDFARFHKEKFSTQNLLVTVPQAISYFADAEDDVDPISLKGQTWESVKDSIKARVRGFLA